MSFLRCMSASADPLARWSGGYSITAPEPKQKGKALRTRGNPVRVNRQNDSANAKGNCRILYTLALTRVFAVNSVLRRLELPLLNQTGHWLLIFCRQPAARDANGGRHGRKLVHYAESRDSSAGDRKSTRLNSSHVRNSY